MLTRLVVDQRGLCFDQGRLRDSAIGPKLDAGADSAATTRDIDGTLTEADPAPNVAVAIDCALRVWTRITLRGPSLRAEDCCAESDQE